tara:strand:+ start:8178 stop:8957 length:780 start_codon:yes stop_codon:yes gene_type:complete
MDRSIGIGGTDAGRICRGDWLNLWNEKTGRAVPEDLTWKLAVQIGIATEKVNLDFLAHELEVEIKRDVELKQDGFMMSHLDGVIANPTNDILVEAKHTYENNDVEKVAQYYYPQLQHYLMHAKADEIYLSIIFGNSKHIWTSIESDPEFQKTLYKREAAFWKFVEDDKEPQGFEDLIVEPPKDIKLDGMIAVDMNNNMKWKDFSKQYLDTKPYVAHNKSCADELKKLVKDDCRKAEGAGVVITRNKKNILTIREVKASE